LDVLAVGSPEMAEETRAYVVLKPDTDLLEVPMEFNGISNNWKFKSVQY
jgi:hypothetical protein